MVKYVIKRLLLAIPIFIGITIFVFVLSNMAPGSPADIIAASSGEMSEEALEELKESVPYKDFQRIVEQLQSAVERIPVRDAFDELETERGFYYERRKEGNQRLIQKKVTYGKVLGFMPLILLIGGYLVAPLMIVSIMQMMSYFSTMTF